MAAVDVVNLALHALGAEEITSAAYTTPVTDLEKTMKDRYPVFITHLFGMYPWHFAKKTTVLSKRTVTMTGASEANPCVITTAATNGIVVDDIIEITGVVGMTELNGNRYRVTAVTVDTSITLDLDTSTGFTTYTSGGTAELKPLMRWKNAFVLPSDLVQGPRKVYHMSSSTDFTNEGQRPVDGDAWDIEGDTLQCDCTAAAIEYYQEVSDDADWESTFKQFAIKAFAAEVAIDVTGSSELRDVMKEDAWGAKAERGGGGLYRDAKNTSSQRAPSEVIQHDPLADARFGRTGTGGGWV